MGRNTSVVYFCSDLRLKSSRVTLLRSILNLNTSLLYRLNLCNFPKMEAERLVPYIYVYQCKDAFSFRTYASNNRMCSKRKFPFTH